MLIRYNVLLQIFMALLWLIAQILIVFMYTPLTKLSHTLPVHPTVTDIQTANGSVSAETTQVEHNTYSNGVANNGTSTHAVQVVNELNASEEEENMELVSNDHRSLKEVLLGGFTWQVYQSTCSGIYF